MARALEAKEPKLVEGPKELMVIRGPSTSEIVTHAMRDLAALKKPRCRILQRKNDIRPFEDATSLEFLAGKNECGAFLYGSHNKKRPHNLVLGRLYDGHVMDMIELGVNSFVALTDIKGAKKALGASPCLIFTGDEWDRSPDLAKLRSLFIDTFAARDLTGIALPALDHVLLVAVRDGIVYFRGYHMTFKRADGVIPRVELTAMGPNLDLRIRRVQHASADLEKAAHRIPSQLKTKKVKNVSTDELGEEHGRIHMEPQDFGKLNMRKTGAYKAARRVEREGEDLDAAAAEGAEVVDARLEEAAAADAMAEDDAPRVMKAGSKRRRGE